MREGFNCSPHTPGVYTTPVAFTSASVFDLDLSFLRSNGQKQSINDAFQYIAVSPAYMYTSKDTTKIQIKTEISPNAIWILHIINKKYTY